MAGEKRTVTGKHGFETSHTISHLYISYFVLRVFNVFMLSMHVLTQGVV